MTYSKYSFKRFEKRLRAGFIPSSGRNYLGTVCVHHRGGGLKKRVILWIFLVGLILLVLLLKF